MRADPLAGILTDAERQTLIAALDFTAAQCREKDGFAADVTAVAHKLELHRDRVPGGVR